MKKIDCAAYAKGILDQVRLLPSKKKLVILTAGDDPASASYMRGKMRDCESCGIPYEQIRVTNQEELLSKVNILNYDDAVGGLIVQLPLPKGFDESEAVNAVASHKDVDGFKSDSPFLPCTPEGILYVLEKEIGDLSGKSVLLIGKGKLVGEPLIPLLLKRGCTLTIAHSKTKDLNNLLAAYHDIVITATGRARLVDLQSTNAEIVIDAGITRADGVLCGDCCGFDQEINSNMRVTAVPGGIGLMTRALLMNHVGGVADGR